MNRKHYLPILFICILISSRGISQITAPAGNYAVTTNPNDHFSYNGNTVPYYSLGWYGDVDGSGYGPLSYLSAFGGLKFFTLGSPRLYINQFGSVMINTVTIPSGYTFAVNGKAIANSLTVKAYPWSDYVFDEGYHLPTLPELESFIKANHHLPDVPSAKDVEKDGIDVGSNQAVLLRKIEELTLIIIQQNKTINSLSDKVNTILDTKKVK